MENKIEQTNYEIVNEIIEKLRGKNYLTAMSILQRTKDELEIHLTLN